MFHGRRGGGFLRRGGLHGGLRCGFQNGFGRGGLRFCRGFRSLSGARLRFPFLFFPLEARFGQRFCLFGERLPDRGKRLLGRLQLFQERGHAVLL